MTRGLLYSSFNQGSAGEVEISAGQAKHVMPGIHITAYSQFPVYKVDTRIPIAPLTIHGETPSLYPAQGFFHKVKNAGLGPYNYTIFLDTDIYIIKSIEGIFELLETGKYHLAVVPDISPFTHEVPSCFPSFNTGLIAYDDSPETKEFFALWWKYFEEKGSWASDQQTFQKALYDSGLKFISLPREYNLRFIFPIQFCSPVYVLHGRPVECYKEVAAEMNKYQGDLQLWNPGPDRKVICRHNMGDILTF